jgi:hypothetical protein
MHTPTIETTMTVTNTHEFEKGERFNTQIDDETIVIRDVREHTVIWDYQVDGETIGRRQMEKKRARKYIQSGHWKEPVEQ